MLEIRSIQKTFGSQTALASIDLSIKEGEFFSLLGPSGCGKSTLLRIIAGLEEATAGEVLWKGRRIDRLPARERPFNMVFQKYALFPHLTVFENVAFGLRLQKLARSELRTRVEEALNLVNLGGFETRKPETLSGGQAQRVALARALANRPSVILLDEPLGALDQKLREHMQTELRLLQRRLGLTFFFVTHDQEEAMILSDRIAVMNSGTLEQVSPPRELFETPRSLFSARFIGGRNEISGVASKGNAKDRFDLELTGSSRLSGIMTCADLAREGKGPARAFVRPERVRVVTSTMAVTRGANAIRGSVVQVLFRGIRTEVLVGLEDGTLLRALGDVELNSLLQIGDPVGLEFSPDETHVFWAGRE
ncbi:MAG: ABC transporter ATP-binding protein [Bdellovibrionota bacterium]